jgi:uncharacterized protein involved in tolerance to divalent cations
MPSNEQYKPITVTFPDGATASKVVDLIVRKKPVGWSRKSFATYYNEGCAMQLKRELDLMIETKKSRLIVMSQKIKSTSTLYLYVNQAWRYLMDFHDSDGVYGAHRNNTIIRKIHGRGIAIWWKDDAESIQGEEISEKKDQKKWKIKMDEYLDSDDVKPFHLDHLILTAEEVEQIKEQLADLSNIMCSVTCKEIKICKIL